MSRHLKLHARLDHLTARPSSLPSCSYSTATDSRELLSMRRPRALLGVLGGVLLVVRSSSGNRDHFESWARSFGRSYKSEEERLERYGHWLASYTHVQTHRARNPDAPYELGLNEFSDWSPEERKRRHHGLRLLHPPQRQQQGEDAGERRQLVGGIDFWGDIIMGDSGGFRPLLYTGKGEGPPPASVDWRVASGNGKGVVGVTKVKNQATCGACWSFATVAAVEGSVAVDQGILNELSNQQMIDCDDPPNKGCEGGDVQYALQYIMKRPLVANADYPFRDVQQPACLADQHEDASKIQTYLEVLSCNEAVLMKAVSHRPIVIAIDAYCEDFQAYQGGILTGGGCSDPAVSCSKQVDHAVTLVGYGTDDKTGLDYWIVKNSWGVSWGDRGYVYLQRHSPGLPCGTSCVSYYGFMPEGGVAYVNGTVYADDDYEHGSADEDDMMVPWRKVEELVAVVAAGVGVGLLLYVLGRAVVAYCCCCWGKGRGARRGSRQGGDGGNNQMRTPLLVDIIDEEDST